MDQKPVKKVLVKCVRGSVDGKDYGLHRASSPTGKKLLAMKHLKGCKITTLELDKEHAPEAPVRYV
jgi:hypothetical protein